MKARKGGNGRRKGRVFYLNGLKVRRHLLTIMERSPLFAIIAHARVSSAFLPVCVAGGFQRPNFSLAVGVRPRRNRGNFCARQLPAQLPPEAPPREWVGGRRFGVWGILKKNNPKERRKKRQRFVITARDWISRQLL